MTSVCKNFLEHPSKCTYGQRCIFQHPTFDVRKRQKYTDMIQDNARYTAMRLFQDIEGSEVIYINTYAATAPRLSVFRGICSSTKDNGEDFIESVDSVAKDGVEAESSSSCQQSGEKTTTAPISVSNIDKMELTVPTFSRDQFRNNSNSSSAASSQ